MQLSSKSIMIGWVSIACLLGIAPKAPPEKIIGAKRSKVFHTHSEECSSAKRIDKGNRIHFPTVGAAEKAGRRLCKICQGLDRKAADKKRKREGNKKDPRYSSDSKGGGDITRPPVKSDAESIQTAPINALPALPEYARAKKVLDGGTLVLDNGDKVFLLGVICPSGDQPQAEDVVHFLIEQTRGRTLRISFDVSPCFVHPRDSLGRSRVFVTPQPDGRDLAGELLFQGYAWLDRGVYFSRREEYERHEEAAWRSGRGIWQRSEGPEGKRKVVIGRHASEFHPPECPHLPYLSGIVKMNLNEAKQRRLVPCSHYRDVTSEK